MLSLALTSFLAAPARSAPAEPSAAATAYANDLLAKMTPVEKIGQMTLFTSHWAATGATVGDQRTLEGQIRAGQCGSVFNARTVAYIRGLQKLAMESTRLHVPLLFGYDVIHGYNTIFPIPLGQAASWDLAAIEQSERIAAREASATGLNWTYAPMVDIARDPRWGRIAEGSGEDPFLGSAIARARVHGFQGDNFDQAATMMACVKHFAGYGAAEAGRDYNTTDISERTLREVYLPAYRAAIDAGAWSVMTAFNDLDGTPATANAFLLKQILRQEWGFKGFVVTDYTAVHELIFHGIAADDAAAARLSLVAGVDLDMQSGAYIEQLPKELAAGRVKLDAIDAAARRILEAKYMLGLVKDPYRYLDEKREAALSHAPENLTAADDLARRSCVLLKNAGSILPLKPGTKLAVIGPLGDNRRELLGCWKAAGKPDGIPTVLEAIKAANEKGQVVFAQGCEIEKGDRTGFPEAMQAARDADVVVVVLGESADMTGEASSRTNIGLPGFQTELLRELKKAGKPIVTVLMNGRPLVLEEEAGLTDALLEAWFPGSAGGSPIAEVLFGKYNPSGRLPVTFPRNLGQVPIYYAAKNTGRPLDPAKITEKYHSAYLDSPNEPLYHFGFGLGYTSFEYTAPKLSRTTLKAGERFTVTTRVKNTGKREGTETVQFYLRQMVGSVTRPVLELKGFQQIALKPGESKDVEFTVGDEQLAFLRADMTRGVEPGQFRAFVGPNSGDLQVAEFEVKPSQ